MKQRIITGILLAIIVAPLIYFGKQFLAAFVILLTVLGVYEFLNIKKKSGQEKIPVYIYIITIICALLLIFDLPGFYNYHYDFLSGAMIIYVVNPFWLVLLVFAILTCCVFDKRFSIIDGVYVIATTLLLSLGLKGMLYLSSFNFTQPKYTGTFLLIYVLLVTCGTDIFAYFGGMTCYKLLGNEKVHKLNERISPKKTIEGTIVGTIFGTVLGFVFAFFVFSNYDKVSFHYPTIEAHWSIYLLMSFIISLTGQIGDLILSAIKRHFNVKDYSNILPGHGGVLDRIDSLLVNFMVTAIFISMITYII